MPIGIPKSGKRNVKRRPPIERFVLKFTPTEAGFTSPCWLWDGHKNPKGYGSFTIANRYFAAHRFSYEFFVGPIPDGLVIDHLCRNTACVNPDHLEPVTNAENIRRGRSGAFQAAKTHCPQDHPYAGENLRITSRGERTCRACQRDRERRRSAA